MTTSQSPMHFNININLDKKGRVANGSSAREASKSSAGAAGESAAASPPRYTSGGFFGGGAQQQQQQQQQQHLSPHTSYQFDQSQSQLRELYSKFSLYQQKHAETEAELAESRTQLLRKHEEVLARDQIIGVLTHTIKMKDHEAEVRSEENRRLRNDLEHRGAVQHNPSGEVAQLRQTVKDMHSAMQNDIAIRDKVINEQLAVMKNMMKKIGANNSQATTPRPSIGLPPSGPPSTRGGYQPTPVVHPSDRLNTAIEIPNQELSLENLMSRTLDGGKPQSRVGSASPSHNSIMMSEEVSVVTGGGSKKNSIASLAAEISERLSETRPPPTPPATKVNTAIEMPVDTIDIDQLSARSLTNYASRATLSRHASRTSQQVPSTPASAVPPAGKPNTAIQIPGEEVEIGSQW
eukprot:TRINITY_DN5193_c2_g1_i1.p1 TRINITY_DN5193_c2_g1~~TRINITY_DN5193_c2_g1_i1.p1  ORF type:complete len:407 (+),score=74.24 TRINITY_DN5193_c2_g1_i1:68-1288(+)